MADYAHLSYLQIQQLDLLEYLALRRDTYIALLARTKSGIDYLNSAWAHEQTEPDREALRKEWGIAKIG